MCRKSLLLIASPPPWSPLRSFLTTKALLRLTVLKFFPSLPFFSKVPTVAFLSIRNKSHTYIYRNKLFTLTSIIWTKLSLSFPVLKCQSTTAHLFPLSPVVPPSPTYFSSWRNTFLLSQDLLSLNYRYRFHLFSFSPAMPQGINISAGSSCRV